MIEPELPFILSEEERNSRLFLKLSDHWKKRLETYRTQNDGDKDEIVTATLRGRIAELKAAISLGDTPRLIDYAAPSQVTHG